VSTGLYGIATRGYTDLVIDTDVRAARMARHVAQRRRLRPASLAATHLFRLAIDDQGGIPRVVLAGDVDLAALPRLRTALRSLLAADLSVIEIDLAEVDLLDTVTAAFLAREQAAAAEAGTALRLTGAGSIPSRLLALAGAQGPGKVEDVCAPEQFGVRAPAARDRPHRKSRTMT
jgi:ABC-type transporter Mla MlaB component